MRSILEKYLEYNEEFGDLVEPGSPAYNKVLEIAGIGGKENRLTYKYVLQELRLVRGKYPHYVALLSGGKNGNGKWDEYLHVMVRMMESTRKKFGEGWVCQVENDVVDDVHDLIIGFPYNNELEIRKEKNDEKEKARAKVYASREIFVQVKTGASCPAPA